MYVLNSYSDSRGLKMWDESVKAAFEFLNRVGALAYLGDGAPITIENIKVFGRDGVERQLKGKIIDFIEKVGGLKKLNHFFNEHKAEESNSLKRFEKMLIENNESPSCYFMDGALVIDKESTTLSRDYALREVPYRETI